jgi:hypothetical protein
MAAGDFLGRLTAWLWCRAQPAPLDAGHPFSESEDYKAALDGTIQSAFADGVQAERKRISEVLNAPGAAMLPELAADLALGDESGAQAAAVLARAETDAAKRAGLMKSNPLESSSSAPTVH